MTTVPNRNETPAYGIPADQLDAMFERTCKQLVADAAERRRQADRPALIDQILNRLMGRSIEDREALAAIDVRLSALEAAMGISRG